MALRNVIIAMAAVTLLCGCPLASKSAHETRDKSELISDEMRFDAYGVVSLDIVINMISNIKQGEEATPDSFKLNNIQLGETLNILGEGIKNIIDIFVKSVEGAIVGGAAGAVVGGAYACLPSVVLYPACVATTSALGAGAGVYDALNELDDYVADSDRELEVSIDFQNHLRNRIIDKSRTLGNKVVDLGTRLSSIDAYQFKFELFKIDAVLESVVKKIEAQGTFGKSFSVFIEAESTIIPKNQRRKVRPLTHRYEGPIVFLNDDELENLNRVNNAIKQGLDNIAEEIVEEQFKSVE
jgi:hypothetical protein